MKTNFTASQLKNPGTARANDILRACVHCGFCTATCPTYQVLGDELDSPRGRIYLMKDMLEGGKKPDAKTVEHVDKCLSCLACMTTCPSGVDYMHLLDHSRAYIHKKYKRPFTDRTLRRTLARVLPYPKRFRAAMLAAKAGKPLKRVMPDKRLRAMMDLVPAQLPAKNPNDAPQIFAPEGPRKFRVALLTGCAQQVLDTEINDATIRLLRRLGGEVVIAKGMGCCGALTHHMGNVKSSHKFAQANIKAWLNAHREDPLDAIIINTSGCGTTVKDYGYIFQDDAKLARDASTISRLSMDITEFLMQQVFAVPAPQSLRVAYHAACSLQHGQKITEAPKALLKKAGFSVLSPKDAHLCCGSAGTYNLMQPEISGELKTRKVATLEALNADVIAAGNIGCMIQIGSGTGLPIVHTVQLLDWALGGPKPRALSAGDSEAAS